MAKSKGEEGIDRKPGSGLKDGLRLRRTRKVQKPREVAPSGCGEGTQ